jgi:nucleotide-binding universal stress UspA family protein
LSLSDGRLFLKEGRVPLQQVISQGKRYQVPVHAVIRLGRQVAEAIVKTADENTSDLILFGWPGSSGANDRLFGSVIDRIVSNPPTDVAILRQRPYAQLRRILVPVAGGPNGRLAVMTAIALARNNEQAGQVVLLHVAEEGAPPRVAEARAKNVFRRTAEGVDFPLEEQIVYAPNPAAGILQAAADCDMVVIGATKEPLFVNLLMGNVSTQVADQAHCPVLIVKRRSTILHSMLRETVLTPVLVSPKLNGGNGRSADDAVPGG